MLVREVSRSAAVAWSPLAHRPNLFAAATLAGTMNVDFDASGKLEIFDMSERANIGLKDSLDAACVGLTSTSERLHRLTWKNPLPNVFQDGLIVGGLGSGAINVWNPTPMLERSKQDPLISSIASHSGAINALDFNPLQQTLLASGGPSGELYIFNLSDPKKPTVHMPGGTAQPASSGSITAVAFHPKHRHILAASSQNGTTVIWDLREKRPTFSFSDNEHRSFRPKSIAWHPNEPMHIAAASDDDEFPLINIWDLHMVMSPKSTLKGHQRGVMAINWCQADKSLMASAGRDNRTLVWDVNTSRLLSEIGSSSNWNLDVQWSPKLPTMLASTSLEGKIRIYSISDYENLATPQSMELATQKVQQAKLQHQQHSSTASSAVSSLSSSIQDSRVLSEEDLFNLPSSSSHPATPQQSSFSSSNNHHHHHPHSQSSILHAARQVQNGAIIPPRPPAWLRRPCGVSFSFGGALIGFNASSRQVSIKHVPSQKALVERAEALQAAMQSGDLLSFCDNKLASLLPNQHSERETWTLLRAMVQQRSPEDEIMALLNIDPEIMSSKVNEYLRTLPTPAGMLEESPSPAPNAHASANGVSLEEKKIPNGAFAPSDGLFEDDDGGDGESGFGKFEIPASAILAQKEAQAQRENAMAEDSSATDLAAAKKPLPLGPPISLASSNQSEEMLTKALIIGDYDSAVECCVRLGRMADALVIAACGGERLWKNTQAIFFRQNKERSYLSIVAALANKNLEDFVARIDLQYWKEAFAVIRCTDHSFSTNLTFYDGTQAAPNLLLVSNPSLFLQLGKRLEKAGNTSAATLCFIASGSVEDVALSWERILTSSHDAFSVVDGKSTSHKDSEQRQMEIQDLMEKVVVFSNTSRLDASQTPAIVLTQFTRYAELVANQGLFETALNYLGKLNLNPQTIQQEKGAAGLATLQLLDRVYHALPPAVARTLYAGNPPALYGRSQASATAAAATASAATGDRRGGNTRHGASSFTPGPSNGPSGPSFTSTATHHTMTAKSTGAVNMNTGTVSRPIHGTPAPAGPTARSGPVTSFVPISPAPGPMNGPTHGGVGGGHGPTTHHRPIATFTPIMPGPPAPPAPVVAPVGPYGSGHHNFGGAGGVGMPGGPRGGFTPVAPVGPSGPVGGFNPVLTGMNTMPGSDPMSGGPTIPPPVSASKAPKKAVASFTPSAPSFSPAPTTAATSDPKLNGGAAAPSPATTTKKKKPKKSAASASASATTTTAPPPPRATGSIASPAPSGSATAAAGSIAFVPGGISSGGSSTGAAPPPSHVGGPGVYNAATGHFAASTTSAPVPMPVPKVTKSRVTPPGANRVVAAAAPSSSTGMGMGVPPPAGTFRGPMPPPTSSASFIPPGVPPPGPLSSSNFPPVAAPGTWDPQAPLPAHLTAGLGAPAPGGAHAPPPFSPSRGGPGMGMGAPAPGGISSSSTPAGFHPPPASSFQTAGMMPMTTPGGGFAPGGGHAVPHGHYPSGSFAPAPAAALPPPPPNPGRAKKEVTTTSPSTTPTPVYITGPEAEAAAMPKDHETTPDELSLLSTLVTVLDKIAGTGDAAHADLVNRFEDFKAKVTSGQIPPAAITLLLSMATSMDQSNYKEAQDQHGFVTGSPHFHAIGSKAMLGFKRMIILLSRNNL